MIYCNSVYHIVYVSQNSLYITDLHKIVELNIELHKSILYVLAIDKNLITTLEQCNSPDRLAMS
jgi:hypothetical protein